MFHSSLAVIATVASSFVLSVTLGAQTSAGKQQGARFACGTFRCTTLYAGQFEMDVAQLFANAPPDELQAALHAHQLASDHITFRIQSLFVETPQNRILIDPGGLDDTGMLLSSMQAAGIDPASIDTVVITHGHYDHYRGSIATGGTAAFPNARYYLQQREWEHWTAPENKEKHLAEQFQRLLVPLRDRFVLLQGTQPIVPGIEAVATPGHSPAHMAVLVGNQVLYTGDVLLTALHVEHPEWTAKFDLWPAEVAATRRRLLERIAEDKLLVVTTHVPSPGIGHVVTNGSAWRWVSGIPE